MHFRFCQNQEGNLIQVTIRLTIDITKKPPSTAREIFLRRFATLMLYSLIIFLTALWILSTEFAFLVINASGVIFSFKSEPVHFSLRQTIISP